MKIVSLFFLFIKHDFQCIAKHWCFASVSIFSLKYVNRLNIAKNVIGKLILRNEILFYCYTDNVLSSNGKQKFRKTSHLQGTIVV